MANTGKTSFKGTKVEVRTIGETVWNKFVCNTGAIEIDFGSHSESSDKCLESGKASLEDASYGDQTFDYFWTQEMTNAADTAVRGQLGKDDADSGVEIRITMDNASEGETDGTTYVIPFLVTGYKHKGENDGKWKTEATFNQTGAPVPTDAA